MVRLPPQKKIKMTLFCSFLLLYARLANKVANTTSDNAIQQKTKKRISVKHWPFTRNGEIYQLHQESIFFIESLKKFKTRYIRYLFVIQSKPEKDWKSKMMLGRYWKVLKSCWRAVELTVECRFRNDRLV